MSAAGLVLLGRVVRSAHFHPQQDISRGLLAFAADGQGLLVELHGPGPIALLASDARPAGEVATGRRRPIDGRHSISGGLGIALQSDRHGMIARADGRRLRVVPQGTLVHAAGRRHIPPAARASGPRRTAQGLERPRSIRSAVAAPSSAAERPRGSTAPGHVAAGDLRFGGSKPRSRRPAPCISNSRQSRQR